MIKVKDFFKNKVVRVIAWIILILDVGALIVGGVTSESISSAVGLAAGVIGAISSVIAFISENSKEL